MFTRMRYHFSPKDKTSSHNHDYCRSTWIRQKRIETRDRILYFAIQSASNDGVRQSSVTILGMPFYGPTKRDQ